MYETVLDTPIEYLKGVGPTRGDTLKKELNIFRFGDLLKHYPYKYLDRSKFYTISEVNDLNTYVQLKGKVTQVKEVGVARKKRYVATLRDETGSIELVWFKGLKWIQQIVLPGREYIVFGKPSRFNRNINIVHPDVDLQTIETSKNEGVLQAHYSSTELSKAKGLDSKGILKLQKELFKQVPKTIPETLPDFILRDLTIPGLYDALRIIHFPKNSNELKTAVFRLKFEELFYIQLRLLKQKLVRTEKLLGKPFTEVGDFFNSFYKEKLPFELTGAQKRVIKEIRADVGSGKQMNRLLQGDVGSGKTLVALMSMLIALDNGCQACLMAPTEILATQHYNTLSELLEGTNVRIDLLTGSTKTAKRKQIHYELESNHLHILIGTHALIESKVKFHNLGFVVIDEQHRFGVEQRSKLWKKDKFVPHVLVMTATPIPRTLAMTLYGDLDISVIDEMPPGRKPITTLHYFESKRLKLEASIKKEIAAGRQVYIVYPLIQESEKLDYANLMQGFDAIKRDFPDKDYKVSIVHGQMKPADKEFEMQQFVEGKTDIMVATTVIEVGVNVPNASIMVIESAERFGLSQLHQLRGRVGRGCDKSYCILLTSYKLSADAKLRMDTMVRTNDGFEISEVDLRLRGPGNLEGKQQSGLVDLKIADLAKDQKILELARQKAKEILEEDPDLVLPKHASILNYLRSFSKQTSDWSLIS